jgi:amidase
MPVTPWVGYKPWTWVKSNQYVGYTSIWNLVDWAALSIPVTTVSKVKDKVLMTEWVAHHARNKADMFNRQQCECRFSQNMM